MLQGVIFIIVCVVLVLSVFRLKNGLDKTEARWFWVGLIIKVLIGQLVLLVFTVWSPEGDIMLYKTHVSLIGRAVNCEVISELPRFAAEPRVWFFDRLLWLPAVASFGQAWLVVVMLSMLSFFASWQLIQTVKKFWATLGESAYIGFLIVPSFVFWTSSLYKETVSFILLAYLINWGIMASKGKSISWLKVILWCCFGITLFYLKYYYFAFIVPVLIAYIVSNRYCVRFKEFYFLFIWAVLISGGSMLHPNLNLDNVLVSIVRNHDATVQRSEVGGYIEFDDLSPSLARFIANSPKAAGSVFLQPKLFAGFNLKLFYGMEQLLILTLIIAAVFYAIRSRIWSFEAGVITFTVFGLCMLLAFASPNYGALSRYKSVVLPFIVLLTWRPFVDLICRIRGVKRLTVSTKD